MFTIYVTSRVACLLLLAAAAKTGFWGLQKSKFFNKFPGTQRATLATLPTPTMLGSVVVMVPKPRLPARAFRVRLAKNDFPKRERDKEIELERENSREKSKRRTRRRRKQGGREEGGLARRERDTAVD